MFIPFGNVGQQLRDGQFVNARNIRGGVISAQEIIIAGGTKGIIRSENFISGTAGWAIFGDGNAEFNNVTIRGDFISSNWDGTEPLDLSVVDATATAGFAFDSSVGSVQVEGDLFANGDIFFGGSIKTAASGDRVEITQSSGSLSISSIHGVGGGTNSIIGLSAGGAINLRGDGTTGSDMSFTDFINIDFKSSTPGTVPSPYLRIGNDSGAYKLTLEGNIGIKVPNGSATAPSVAFADDTDTGIYRYSANRLGVSTGGTIRTVFDEFGIRTVNGSGTRPAYSFNNDDDTGWYLDSIGVMVGVGAGATKIAVTYDGVRLLAWDTTGDNMETYVPSSGHSLTANVRTVTKFGEDFVYYRKGGGGGSANIHGHAWGNFDTPVVAINAHEGGIFTNKHRGFTDTARGIDISGTQIALEKPSVTTNTGLASVRHDNFAASGTTYNLLPLTSTEKLKKDIRDITPQRARTILKKYRPREWHSLAGADPKNLWITGFVVEEMPKTPVDLVSPLVVLVKELQEEVAALKERLDSLPPGLRA